MLPLNVKNKIGVFLKTIFALSLLLLFTACSSSNNKKIDTEPNPNPVREFKAEFETVDASEKQFPDWVNEPAKIEKNLDERSKFRYFVNESSNESQRLCEKSAEARATAHIAGEIAQFIKNSYAEATQEESSYMQDSLGQEIQSFIHGSSLAKKYWEKRHYKKALGSTDEKVIYYCYAVVRMGKKDLEEAVSNAVKKMIAKAINPESKAKTQEVLKDVAKKFNDL